MKTATILFGFLFLYVAVDARRMVIKNLGRALRECCNFLHPDLDSMKMALNVSDVENRGANCLRACSLNAIGFMNNSKLVIANMMTVFNEMEGAKPEEIKNWTKMMTHCKSISETTEDKCDVVGNFLKCLRTIFVHRSKDYETEIIPSLQKMLLKTII